MHSPSGDRWMLSSTVQPSLRRPPARKTAASHGRGPQLQNLCMLTAVKILIRFGKAKLINC